MSQESNLQSTSTNGSHKLGLSHVIKDRKDFLSYYKRLYRILAKESTLTGVDGVNDNHNTDSDTFISLTAREMYEKKAFHDAVKALLSGHASGHLADHIALNNLGCLNFRQGKYTLACLYFSKTLVEMDKSLFNRENRQQEGLRDVTHVLFFSFFFSTSFLFLPHPLLNICVLLKLDTRLVFVTV